MLGLPSFAKDPSAGASHELTAAVEMMSHDCPAALEGKYAPACTSHDLSLHALSRQTSEYVTHEYFDRVMVTEQLGEIDIRSPPNVRHVQDLPHIQTYHGLVV